MSIWIYFLDDERRGRPGILPNVGTDRRMGPGSGVPVSKNLFSFSASRVERDWNRQGH